MSLLHITLLLRENANEAESKRDFVPKNAIHLFQNLFSKMEEVKSDIGENLKRPRSDEA